MTQMCQTSMMTEVGPAYTNFIFHIDNVDVMDIKYMTECQF
jgi:hypothetical protein